VKRLDQLLADAAADEQARRARATEEEAQLLRAAAARLDQLLTDIARKETVPELKQRHRPRKTGPSDVVFQNALPGLCVNSHGGARALQLATRKAFPSDRCIPTQRDGRFSSRLVQPPSPNVTPLADHFSRIRPGARGAQIFRGRDLHGWQSCVRNRVLRRVCFKGPVDCEIARPSDASVSTLSFLRRHADFGSCNFPGTGGCREAYLLMFKELWSSGSRLPYVMAALLTVSMPLDPP